MSGRAHHSPNEVSEDEPDYTKVEFAEESSEADQGVTHFNDLECSIYQNYTASEVFVQGLAGIVNQQDVEAMIRAQKKMLQRFEKTNEMLSNCNSLSQTRLERALRDFRGHTQHINGLKKELEQVFKRIRVIKSRVAQQYPEAFKASGAQIGPIKEEDDEYDIELRKKKESSNDDRENISKQTCEFEKDKNQSS